MSRILEQPFRFKHLATACTWQLRCTVDFVMKQQLDIRMRINNDKGQCLERVYMHNMRMKYNMAPGRQAREMEHLEYLIASRLSTLSWDGYAGVKWLSCRSQGQNHLVSNHHPACRTGSRKQPQRH
ncbi:hypothetical protein DPEC_G00132460 [Dallia pectoralis]|uniref:Uncharacterized protein n=1 Tax=Dallia pectoralis TaxID=75939 RepID=A0ACC2GRQ7_DALPE|nr:hypothetical protein DPEC_G00132460 [Dallia pectoralis]